MLTNNVDRHQQLQAKFARLGREPPGPLAGFAGLHKAAMTSGTLSPKIREFFALGIAVATHCKDCIAYHVHDALKAGASREQVVEALGVAILVGGGPAAMYACHALKAVGQSTTADD